MATEQTARFVYLSTPRTLQNGQDVRPSLDVHGNLVVSGTVAGGPIPVTPTVSTYAVGTPTTATATGTSGIVLIENSNRKVATIVNVGAASVFLAVGTAAIYGSGIALAAGAGYEWNSTNLTHEQIHAITAGTSVELSIMEGV